MNTPIVYRIAKETKTSYCEYNKVYYSATDVIRAIRMMQDSRRDDMIISVRAYAGDRLIKEITYN